MKTALILLMTSRAMLLVILLGLGIVFAPGTTAEPKSADQYLARLPTDLAAPDNETQVYDVTSTMHNRDLSGNVMNRFRLTAEYTRRTADGQVHCRWKGVRIAAPQTLSEPIGEGGLLDYMEGFSYTVSEEIVGEDLFKVVPDQNIRHLIKTLVWDAATFEPYFWDHFENLDLNSYHSVSEFEDFEVEMGDWGTLRMKDLRMAWTGISERNNEICALLDYKSFANPVDSRSGSMTITGRSLYWGSIWVSLEDKQVEYAILNEDVVMEMARVGTATKTLMDMQREVVFEKRD